jgi:hypothetical protein
MRSPAQRRLPAGSLPDPHRPGRSPFERARVWPRAGDSNWKIYTSFPVSGSHRSSVPPARKPARKIKEYAQSQGYPDPRRVGEGCFSPRKQQHGQAYGKHREDFSSIFSGKAFPFDPLPQRSLRTQIIKKNISAPERWDNQIAVSEFSSFTVLGILCARGDKKGFNSGRIGLMSIVSVQVPNSSYLFRALCYKKFIEK